MTKKKETVKKTEEPGTTVVAPKPDKTLPGPGREYFAVNSISKQKGGGLKIDYTTMHPTGFKEGATFFSEKDIKTSQRVPIEEFNKALHDLRIFVAKVCHYEDVKILNNDKEFKTNGAQAKFIQNLYDAFVKRIEINGVKIWATGEYITACEINYSLEGLSSQKMAHSTYKIDLKEEMNVHGFEEELRAQLVNIVIFSYDYIFLKAGAQLEAFE